MKWNYFGYKINLKQLLLKINCTDGITFFLDARLQYIYHLFLRRTLVLSEYKWAFTEAEIEAKVYPNHKVMLMIAKAGAFPKLL